MFTNKEQEPVLLAASDEGLNAFWSGLSKKQQKNVKQIANPLNKEVKGGNESETGLVLI